MICNLLPKIAGKTRLRSSGRPSLHVQKYDDEHGGSANACALQAEDDLLVISSHCERVFCFRERMGDLYQRSDLALRAINAPPMQLRRLDGSLHRESSRIADIIAG